jgi:hypothetical protein
MERLFCNLCYSSCGSLEAGCDSRKICIARMPVNRGRESGLKICCGKSIG